MFFATHTDTQVLISISKPKKSRSNKRWDWFCRLTWKLTPFVCHNCWDSLEQNAKYNLHVSTFVGGIAAKQTPRHCSLKCGCWIFVRHDSDTFSAVAQAEKESARPTVSAESLFWEPKYAHTTPRETEGRQRQMWIWLPAVGWRGLAVSFKVCL